MKRFRQYITEKPEQQRDLEVLTDAIVNQLIENGTKSLENEFKSSQYPNTNLGKHFYVYIEDVVRNQKFDIVNQDFLSFVSTPPYVTMKIVMLEHKSETNAIYLRDGIYRTIEININATTWIRAIDGEISNYFIDNGELSEILMKGILIGKYEKRVRSSILHEVEHAFRDFLSDGKSLDSKRGKEYRKAKRDEMENKRAGDKSDASLHIQYLKQPHEITARYTQTIDKIKFWKVEGNKGFKKNRGLNDYVFNFKMKFVGWDILTDKMKQNLLKKVTKEYNYLSPEQTTQVKYHLINQVFWQVIFDKKINWNKIKKKDPRYKEDIKKETTKFVKDLIDLKVDVNDLLIDDRGLGIMSSPLREIFDDINAETSFKDVFKIREHQMVKIRQKYEPAV